MSKFSLLQDLDSNRHKKVDKPVSGIRYQQYELTVEGKKTTINIPIREAQGFEKFMEETSDITGDGLRSILRHYRGTKARDEE